MSLVAIHNFEKWYKLSYLQRHDVEELIFGIDYDIYAENSMLTHVEVYKTLIDGDNQSDGHDFSTIAMERQQKLPSYDSFLVIRTSCGICFSVRALEDGIYIGTNAFLELSAENTELFLEDSSPYGLDDFTDFLNIIDKDESDKNSNNFKHNRTIRRIFDEVTPKQHDEYFKFNPDEDFASRIFGQNLEHAFENERLSYVAVYRVFFDRAIKKNPYPSIGRAKGKRVIQAEDTHDYLILWTDRGVSFSLEARPDGIFIGKSPWHELGLIQEIQPESHQIELRIESASAFSLASLFEYLKDELSDKCSTDYFFPTRIFDKVALIQHDAHFKLSPSVNVAEKLLGDDYLDHIEDTVITHIEIHTTPLTAIYKSSNKSIKQYFARQWTRVDYHAFLILNTNIGTFLSLEKQQDGIYISKSMSYERLVYGLQLTPRNTPVQLVMEDESKYSLADLIDNLKCESDVYHPTDDNCQHFAKRHFDKVASKKQWHFDGPLEYLHALYFKLTILVICSITLYYLIFLLRAVTLELGHLFNCSTLFIVRYRVFLILRGVFLLLNIGIFFAVTLRLI